MHLPATPARRGISLLEVLVAALILLSALAAISQLLDFAGARAAEIRDRSIATQLAQSKLNEFVAGVLPLGPQGGTFEEQPDWEWEADVSQHEVTGLWDVRLWVRRRGASQD